uniref:Uncharacterized protein n=1 Tax=Coccidioides posadasii RMSCC 3488 TaxID=454284 RepID=A0A0J6FFS7_COCPO|nr:hypothetical protein CPAG_05445 [Coccidioides posadasii RMSCC 3488]
MKLLQHTPTIKLTRRITLLFTGISASYTACIFTAAVFCSGRSLISQGPLKARLQPRGSGQRIERKLTDAHKVCCSHSQSSTNVGLLNQVVFSHIPALFSVPPSGTGEPRPSSEASCEYLGVPFFSLQFLHHRCYGSQDPQGYNPT